MLHAHQYRTNGRRANGRGSKGKREFLSHTVMSPVGWASSSATWLRFQITEIAHIMDGLIAAADVLKEARLHRAILSHAEKIGSKIMRRPASPSRHTPEIAREHFAQRVARGSIGLYREPDRRRGASIFAALYFAA